MKGFEASLRHMVLPIPGGRPYNAYLITVGNRKSNINIQDTKAVY